MMTDDDQNLDVIDGAFAGFRAGGPLGVPLGSDVVRSTVRHRRKVRATTGAALAILLIAGPVGLYASGAFDADKTPPQVGTSHTATAGLSPTEHGTPDPSGIVTAPSGPADGRVADPANATLPLSGWPAFVQGGKCATGMTKFFQGTHSASGQSDVQVLRSADLDLDGDGAQETVVLLRCAVNDIGYRMVLAFDRDAGGAVVQLGKVVQNVATDAKSTNDVRAIKTMDDIRANGSVVEVHVGGDATAATDSAQWQWRAYAWNGSAFTQSGGPSSFPSPTPATHRTTLVLSPVSTEVTFTRNGANRMETTSAFTFTVRNDGPVATTEGRIVFLGSGVGQWRTTNTACTTNTRGTFCPITLGVGETKTLSFSFFIVGENLGQFASDDRLHISADTAASTTANDGYQLPVTFSVPTRVIA